MDLSQSIKTWAETIVGGPLITATRLPGGGSNQAWLVTFSPPKGQTELFLRIDATALAAQGDAEKLKREHNVYRALAGTGLPVARAMGVSPDGDALLLTRVDGDASFGSIADPDARRHIAHEFMHHLATLHRLDLVTLAIPGFDAAATLAACAQAQIDWITNVVATRGGVPDPVLALAVRWLSSHIPAHVGRPVLVQGDTGPGNFLHDGIAITAIVDWELAHPGDPMDDLAWVSLRSVQDPFGDQTELFAAYEQASGNPVDADRIRYYRVMAEAKILAMSHATPPATRGEAGRDAGAAVIFGHLHRRLCVEALSDAMRVPLETLTVPTAPPPGEAQQLIDAVLDSLRTDVVPRISDAFAARRVKSSARVLKYVGALIGQGTICAAAETEQIGALLEQNFDNVREARDALSGAIVSGYLDNETALHIVAVRVAHDQALTFDASGSLALRHYADL
jgi:aminoglycoside phosphotransferase (APT) family kinase protein